MSERRDGKRRSQKPHDWKRQKEAERARKGQGTRIKTSLTSVYYFPVII